jgi:hypothetical protein
MFWRAGSLDGVLAASMASTWAHGWGSNVRWSHLSWWTARGAKFCNPLVLRKLKICNENSSRPKMFCVPPPLPEPDFLLWPLPGDWTFHYGTYPGIRHSFSCGPSGGIRRSTMAPPQANRTFHYGLSQTFCYGTSQGIGVSTMATRGDHTFCYGPPGDWAFRWGPSLGIGGLTAG